MKQLVTKTQGLRFLALSFFFLAIGSVAVKEAPRMFSIIMLVVIAFVGTIGMIKVHKKFKSGASDTQAAAINWFGSFLILVMLNTMLRSIFL